VSLEIRLEEANGKGTFTAWEGERPAGRLTFSRVNAKVVIVDHTEALDGFKGRGVGKGLVAHAVEWARGSGQQIMPLCPFTRVQFERTPEYADVWFR
jgi:predicted GNAT family acetyltransferase